jgi:hypothetical protein
MGKMMIIALMVVAGFILANANPLMPVNLSEYSTSPPWIELTCYSPDTLDFSGAIIRTMGGNVIIDNGIFIIGEQSIVLDSSNTSGFAFNPDGDSIVIDEYYIYVGFGCRGNSAPPVAEESAAWTHWHNGNLNFCMAPSPGDWAESPVCAWGQTEVVLNEITINCGWERDCNFVELYNRSSVPVDISGWQIIGNYRQWVPSNTTIASHGYYILDQEDAPAWFGVSPGCDNVYLLNATENLVDQVGWTSDHGENVSVMRFPNGGHENMPDNYYMGYSDETSVGFSEGFPSRGAFNRSVNPGLKVIGTRFEYSGDRVHIYWTNPYWFSTFSQVILRKSLTEFPQTPFDGELIFEGREQEYLYDYVPSGQTAYYTVFARTSCGDYSIPDSEAQVSVMSIVGIDEDAEMPERTEILECYPNPFNASVTIKYNFAEPGLAELAIYNVAGQKVTTLMQGQMRPGENLVTWRALGMPSGVYFARLEAGKVTRSTRLVLLK